MIRVSLHLSYADYLREVKQKEENASILLPA